MNKKIKMIVLVILLIIFVLSGLKVYNYIKETYINNKLNSDLISKAVIINDNSQEIGESEIVPIVVDFSQLKQKNNDIVGWIYSENTPINYPVVQGTDNESYIHTLVNKKYGSSGTLFMDYRNNSNITDNNTIIYGHNMKNNTMFGTIKKYKNQSYYDNHKIMYYLMPEKSYKLELFAGYTTTIESNIYDLNKLDQNIINEFKRQSNFKNDVIVNEEDKILTLSTCAYDYEDARYVLMGVLREI